MSEDDIDDLIGEFVFDGYRFKVVTSKVPTENPYLVDVIRAGGEFATNFFITVPHVTYDELVANDNVDTYLEMMKELAPKILEHLEEQ